ncbi:hypothetical protein K437DRAFT_26255 [Tilletiaria anomala UBC 951]|uniref:Carbohydrate-binding module family 13 protein n=1 Tax=Tilletiaria anomala (strain ATCC 24038 / CBS 436.72 / UBC 951) TaxID=1037660 RepID=A0A066WMP4_TILAU|nr:uncharacterized protein K437DRAFT_26255 [Tilletiaria anomala UBC 951]KDN52279.1 hypothetical protein K437DRAFT_26255 [Tilletiaria anomala UBC 951]
MNNTIANTERFTVAYCTQPGYGTRLIPDGTLTSVHFVKTPNYVQVVANGDFTKINIAPGDEGGELDPHGDDGNGNPEGTLVYSRAFGNDSHGNPKQMHQWMQFISYSQACFRACVNNDAYDSALCQHIYDKMGCGWVMPSNYTVGAFDNCEGDNGDPPGVYGTSTWYQGDCGAACAPPAHDPPASSNCQNIASPMNKVMLPGMTTSTTMSSMTTSASSTNPSSGSGSSSSSSSNHSGAVGQVGTSSLGATALVVAAAIGAGALLL